MTTGIPGASGARRRLAPISLLLALLTALLAGCGDAPTSTAYGGAKNHLHDVLALAGQPATLLVAAHIGLYRSTDSGKTWREVAGGAGQPMDGLMIYKFAQSPVEAQRVYIVAVPRPDDTGAARDVSGVYISDDAGQTWKLASPATAFPSTTLFSLATGAGSAGQLYVLTQGSTSALSISDDAGQRWRTAPAFPVDSVNGFVADPKRAGRLLAYSLTKGLFISDDNGQRWKTAPGIRGGIYAASVAGPMIYASGDSGLYVSHDSGASFGLASADFTFAQVTGSPGDPTRAYALGSAAVYASADAGKTWQETSKPDRNPGNLALDPTNAATVYIGQSYPIGLEASSDAGGHWRALLP